MSTLTIELDNSLARELEASAKRESKPISLWAAERLKLAAMESTAAVNGYPPGWLKLFGSVSDKDGFEAPNRSTTRAVGEFEGD